MGFFSRLMEYAQYQGLKNANELAERLGYASPEKLYRLKRAVDAKPSFDILRDVANLFASINMRWLIVGEGQMDVELEAHTPPVTSGDHNISEGREAYTPMSSEGKVHPKNKKTVHPTVHPTPYLRELLDEKDRVIYTQDSLIQAQAKTITLLEEKCAERDYK